MANNKTIYEIAAEKAVDLLKEGKMPMFESGPQPVGALTGKPYQGINGTLLSMSGHTDPRWITREQADQNKIFVTKDEKASKVLKQKWTKSVAKMDPQTGFPQRDSRGRVVTQTVRLQNPTAHLEPVFNASQMQDVPPLGNTIRPYDPIQRAEEVFKNSGITIKHDQKEREHYNPRLHEIHMKPEDAYASKEQYLEAGLYQLAQAMAREGEIRSRGVGDEEKNVRDQFAFARAHAVLCSSIGIEASTDRQLEHTHEFIDTLEKNPYTIMEASKLASEIVNEVQAREQRRNPELAADLVAEQQAMIHVSPKVEVQNHRTMQRVLSEHENNSDNVFIFQHEGQELYARKGTETLYSKPSETPAINDVFDLKHQTTAFNREGEMFNVVMTSTFIQLADGRSEQIADSSRPEVTDLNRSAMFPADWTGELKVVNAMLDENQEMILSDIPDHMADVLAVCAVRENGDMKAVKGFDVLEDAAKFAEIYEDEHERQTGKFKEKSLEGVTFFHVPYTESDRQAANDLGLEYYGQVKSFGAPSGTNLDAIRNRFDEHDPYQRMAEIEARKAERAAGIGVTVIDVPKGREDEAAYLGAMHSKKHGHFFIPENVNPEPLLERFNQMPAVMTQETPARETFTVPYQDRDEAAQAGIVYNGATREYEAAREVSPEAQDRWGSEHHGQETPLLTPAQEAAIAIESVGIDLGGEDARLEGIPIAADIADDIPNQKNGMYVAYEDGSCYAKNNLTQEEIYHPGKGYVLTAEMRETMRETARELLTGQQKAEEARMDKVAEKQQAQIAKLPHAAEQTPYMRDNGIEPMEGIHAKGKNTIIPLVNSGGEIRSSITIKPDGATIPAPGGQTVGAFAAIGGYEAMRNSPAIIVTVRPEEGAAIHNATGYGVAATIQENNVKAVVNGIKAEMGNKPVLLAVGNMLDKTVREVTAATNVATLTPTFAEGERDKGMATFKDMAMSSKLGLEGVKNQVTAGAEKAVSKAREIASKEQSQERKAGRQQELSLK